MLLRDFLKLCATDCFVWIQNHFHGPVKRVPVHLGNAKVIRVSPEGDALYVVLGGILL